MLKILVEGIIFFSRRVFVLFSKFFLLNVRWKQKDVCKTRKAQRHWSGIALQSRLQIVIPCTVSCELVPARPHPQRGGPVSTSCLISCFSFCHQLLPGFRFRSVPYRVEMFMFRALCLRSSSRPWSLFAAQSSGPSVSTAVKPSVPQCVHSEMNPPLLKLKLGLFLSTAAVGYLRLDCRGHKPLTLGLK